MIVDVHTHVFRPEQDFGPRLIADLKRCGVEAKAWGEVSARHASTTQAADLAVVFGIQAAATGWHVPNDFVAAHARTEPERFIFFASIDPGQPDFETELR